MQGLLDHLEPAPHGGHLSLARRPPVWTRRFVRLNAGVQTLELFADASQQQRVARLELAGAEVASADELGELLMGHQSAAIPVQHSRRFVFRVAVPDPKRKHKTELHYLCAEQPPAEDEDGRVDAAASRACLAAWLRALRTAAACSGSTIAPLLDMRDVHAKLAAFAAQLFVSSHVTARLAAPDGDPHKPGQYELTCVAWTLVREDARQVLEYACEWRVAKTSAQLRDLDAQLRIRGVGDRDGLRDLALPSFQGVRAFLHHSRHHDADEDARRAALMDAYWQKLLSLPAFSVFGGDGAAMLDLFLELSPHLGGFKKIEAASGQSLHLGKKRVVPWRERETFEQLFNVHQQMVRADEEKKTRQSPRRHQTSESRHRTSGSHRQKGPSDKRVADETTFEEEDAFAGPPPVELVAPAEPVDSVHQRIARIGHKLLVEAFTTPAAATRAES